VDEVCTSFKEILDKHGKVDILVNNAGITKDNLLARMTESDWDDVINVNLKSVYACSKMVILSMMKQRWGRIINISSVVAESGNPGQVNYTASKGGMISFTKTLAKEVGSRFITVNAITPGYIQTEMTAGLPEKVKQAMFDQIPLGHFGEPEDVGSLVSFLASDNGSYITGQVIGINGGLYV
jgi:3-oxoacyl-[acyl-carrier protein] reductase